MRNQLYSQLTDETLLDTERFLKEQCGDELADLWEQYPKEKTDVWINYRDILRWNDEFADIILGEIEEYTHEHLMYVFAKVVCEIAPPQVARAPDVDSIDIRIYNLEDVATYDVGGYWADDLGRYISITGQIRKATMNKPSWATIAWECLRCGSLTSVPQLHTGNEQMPDQCSGCERKGPFGVNTPESEAVDHQLLRLEQPLEEGNEGDTIDVRIEGDLVKWLGKRLRETGGTRVTVSGVLETGDSLNEDGTGEWVLDAKAIEIDEQDWQDTDIDEHIEVIREYANGEHGDVFTLLVESIAPSLMGTEIIEGVEYQGEERSKLWWIRLACVLANLFQGWRRPNSDGTFVRGSGHVLNMGDPSTGKSTLMAAIRALSQRSSSASGKGASGAGLTAAAVKDDFGASQWTLEPGALPKGHKGVTTIDEIDKMGKETVSALHSAMEQQRVEVNKAGINATLKCETSILAAGNPKESRFHEYEDKHEQIDIVGSLLDRFDFVFVIQDIPEKDQDKQVAEHVIEARTESGLKARDDVDDSEVDDTTAPAIPEDVLRAWIALARRDYHPVIRDDEVKQAVAEFYADIRSQNGDNGDGPVPASVRNLDGILRTAEAAARARLSNTIEMVDVDIAQKVIMASLTDIGYDPETGQLDVDIATGNQSYSQRDRRQRIKGMVRELEPSESGAGVPVDEVLSLAESSGIDPDTAEQDIEKLRMGGELYTPATDELRTS